MVRRIEKSLIKYIMKKGKNVNRKNKNLRRVCVCVFGKKWGWKT